MHVAVTLTSEFAYVTDADEGADAVLAGYWSFYVPSARFVKSHKLWMYWKRHRAMEMKKRGETGPVDTAGLPGWDGRIRLYSDGQVPAGLFRATHAELEVECGVRFKITYDLVPACDTRVPVGDTKYRYQARCANAMIKSYHRGGCIALAATASGKTKTAADFASAMHDKTILFVVNRKTLLYQAQKELAAWTGEKIGIVGDSQYELQRITVATVQTLKPHAQTGPFKKWFRKIHIVIVDELHIQMSRKNFALLNAIAPVARYGLTATLELDKKDVRMRAFAYAGPVRFTFPIVEAQEAGVVAKGSMLQLVFEEEQNWRGRADYQLEYRQEIVDNVTKRRAVGQVVRALLEQDRRVLVLASRIAHVRALLKELPRPLRVISGTIGRTKQAERDEAQMHFELGEVKLLVATDQTLGTGTSVKRIDAIIDAAEKKSRNDVQQKFGRGLRLHRDKKDLVYIDVATQAGRFRKAAMARVRIMRKIGIAVKRVKVSTAQQAVAAVEKYLKRRVA